MSEISEQRVSSGLRLALKLRLQNYLGQLKIKRSDPQQPLQQHEFRVFSQHREDGIIEYLLALVGSPHKTFVEFGFHPHQNNCLNLALNHGYSGLFMDGDAANCAIAREVYQRLNLQGVTIANAFLTTDNINGLISEHGLTGEIDVLSVDIDGNDYWLWQAIDVVQPRIVIAEYNASFGDARAITVPYDPAFVRYDVHDSGFYHGASLAALDHLGKQKGFTLMGCDYTGVNAFFVRNDLLTKHPADFDPPSVQQAWVANRGRVKYKGVDTPAQWERIKDLPYVDVTQM